MASKFSELTRKLERKGYSKRYASAVAYKAGVKKYGKAGMARKAVAGRRAAAKQRRK